MPQKNAYGSAVFSRKQVLAEPDKGYRLRKLVIVDGPAFLTWQVVSVRKTEQHGNELRLREWVNFGHASDLSLSDHVNGLNPLQRSPSGLE